MKILWLDFAGRVGRYDTWLHTDFALELRKSVDDLFFYAPQMHEKIPQHTPIVYQADILMKDIIRGLGVDTIILDTRAAAYDNYFPQTIYPDNDVGILWLPKDFKDVDCLKICIEEDYQYELNDDWHKEMGFKAVLQKHYIHTLRTSTALPVIFFPWSVDTDTFKQVKTERQPRIGFAGTIGSVYKPRKMAYDELVSMGYLAPMTATARSQIKGEAYVKYLQDYMGYLSCGSIYNLTPAKMVEIMASGGVLFTNKTIGLDKLFPDDAYMTYESDGRDIKEKVERLFGDKEYRDKTVERGLKCIKERHSHEVRVKELLAIIKEFE